MTLLTNTSLEPDSYIDEPFKCCNSTGVSETTALQCPYCGKFCTEWYGVEEGVENYIKFEDCVEGCLYQVVSRNLGDYAFFVNGTFHGPRFKIFEWFMTEEEHWDKDQNYGTVKPIRKIG